MCRRGFRSSRSLTIANLTSGADPRRFRYLLPERLLRHKNRLLFELPGARSPHSLGLSEDVRRLGLALERMILEDASAIALPEASAAC